MKHFLGRLWRRIIASVCGLLMLAPLAVVLCVIVVYVRPECLVLALGFALIVVYVCALGAAADTWEADQ